jgi:alkylation response protein AidB-like acyl-CoA dehydrogenase
MTSFFPLQAQQEVWDDPDNLLAVSYTPSPKVEVVDGGIKIVGSWPWASGVDSAAWLILSVLIPGKDTPPTLAWCLVPVRDVIVDHDSWNVSGLQGTGSKTVAINDPVFRPGAPDTADRRDLFRQGAGARCARQCSGAFWLSDFRPDGAGRADRRDGARGARCLH